MSHDTDSRERSEEEHGGLLKRLNDGSDRAIEWFCSRPRCVWGAVVFLLAVHAGLLAYSATRHSPTLNEPGHLVAGLSHWKFGRFELYRVNPPLVRMIAALPVMAVGYEEDWSGFYESPGARPVFSMGEEFIAVNGERSIWLFTIARWSCIPISLLGGLFCFLWSRELWQHNVAGLISLILWCFEPNILAHGELITPDCAATSFGLGAGYFFWRWLRQPSWGRAFAAGGLLGLAELSKMTWVILFGLWPILWLFWLWSNRHSVGQDAGVANDRLTLISLAQLTAILVLGLYLLNVGYGFDGSFNRLEDFTFVSSALTGKEESGTPGNRFEGNWLGELPVPVPKQHLLGMDVQKHEFEDYGQFSYLRGEWKDGGWWYYYLYGLAVKTPHGTQFLLLVSIITLAHQCCKRAHDAAQPLQVHRLHPVHPFWRDVIVLMTPAVTIMVLVSSQLGFNHHVRYVLPVLGFTFVFVGGASILLRCSPECCLLNDELRS